MTAGDMLKGTSFVFSINRSFQLEDLTQSYIAGTENTKFAIHRDSQTPAPEIRCVSLLAVDILSSLKGTMPSLALLPNKDHFIKSEIGSFRSVRVNASSISDLMEHSLLFLSSMSPCLRGKIPLFDQ